MYRSPEQATHASPPDARSEVYSLSVILYEALSGALPLPRCATESELLTVLVTHDLRPLEAAAPWVDRGLSDVIERGLGREPSRRWSSPAELAEALVPFTGGSERITATMLAELPQREPISPAQAAAEGAPHGRGWLLAVALGVLALLVGAGVWLVKQPSSAHPQPSRLESPRPDPAPGPLLPPKREVALALLEYGSAFIHLDPRRPGVIVPKQFKGQPQLILQVGRNMAIPIPDLDVGDTGITATLSFSQRPFLCRVPWSAVYALVGDDGRGGVWAEDVPPEVAAQRAGKQDASATDDP
jgi:serine/threonine protein kinase